MINSVNAWIILGFFGQTLFSLRFIVQWLSSEKVKRSVIPLAFWYFSLGGGAILFIYALHRNDPVFAVGQGSGLFIYIRNLYLVYRERRHTDLSSTSSV